MTKSFLRIIAKTFRIAVWPASSALILAACATWNPEQRQAFAQALADGVPAPAQQARLLIFGGTDHKTYLGCLNCDKDDLDSIFNPYGAYGSCHSPFADNLFCRGPFREFGNSGPFQYYSACSSNAVDPPVIVDEAGAYYGRFSIGGSFAHVDAVCNVLTSFHNSDACELVEWVCNQ